jgi:nuclear inhibitor of protein phosphatase 1
LTEYNTAHNRKISTLGINDAFVAKKGSKRKRVHFNEDEIVINPEDIDDSVGKFRNLVNSTVIPLSNKRMRIEGGAPSTFTFPTPSHTEQKHILHHPIISAPTLYSSSLLPALPNPAPDIEVSNKPISSVQFKSQNDQHETMDFDMNEPKRKKYAKEAWPKKAPKNHLGDI